jgi:hypothetical protein
MVMRLHTNLHDIYIGKCMHISRYMHVSIDTCQKNVSISQMPKTCTHANISVTCTSRAQQLEQERDATYAQIDAMRRAQREASLHMSGLQDQKLAEAEDAERRLASASARLVREKQELADVCAQRDSASLEVEELRKAKREETAKLTEVREREIEAEEVQRKAARIAAKLAAQHEELSELKTERDKVLEELEKARLARRETSLRATQDGDKDREIEDLDAKLSKLQIRLKVDREEVRELSVEKQGLILELERMRRSRLEKMSESVIMDEKEREAQELDRRLMKLGSQVRVRLLLLVSLFWFVCSCLLRRKHRAHSIMHVNISYLS